MRNLKHLVVRAKTTWGTKHEIVIEDDEYNTKLSSDFLGDDALVIGRLPMHLPLTTEEITAILKEVKDFLLGG